MVEWKGQLDGKVGGKARRLDKVESFHVPNFFAVTKDEVEALVNGKRESEEISSDDMPEELSDRLEEAYNEINMSSEVRNASGKARNLVGGQRNSSRVSVRISADKDGSYEYRLNVGSKEIDDALVEVVKSYYGEHSSGFPAVIVQKMVEPEASGAALKLEGGNLIETVKGLGTALEEACTVPDIYVPSRGEKRIPESQLETTVNPMSGEIRSRETARNSALLKNSQIRQLSEKLDSERYSIKFTYSRGSFYAVDAFETPNLELPEELDGLNVSGKPVEPGSRVVDVPENISKPTFARNGGYTSTEAQRARRLGIPAVFSYTGGSQERKGERDRDDSGFEPGRISQVTATQVLRADRELPARLEDRFNVDFQEAFVETASGVLKFQAGQLVLDSRGMEDEVAVRALELLDPEFLCVVVEYPVDDVISAAVRNGAEVVAVANDAQRAEEIVLREEKRLLLDHARD